MLAALKLPDVEAVNKKGKKKRVTVGAPLPDDGDDPGKRPVDFEKLEKYISSKGKVPTVPGAEEYDTLCPEEKRKLKKPAELKKPIGQYGLELTDEEYDALPPKFQLQVQTLIAAHIEQANAGMRLFKQEGAKLVSLPRGVDTPWATKIPDLIIPPSKASPASQSMKRSGNSSSSTIPVAIGASRADTNPSKKQRMQDPGAASASSAAAAEPLQKRPRSVSNGARGRKRRARAAKGETEDDELEEAEREKQAEELYADAAAKIAQENRDFEAADARAEAERKAREALREKHKNEKAGVTPAQPPVEGTPEPPAELPAEPAVEGRPEPPAELPAEPAVDTPVADIPEAPHAPVKPVPTPNTPPQALQNYRPHDWQRGRFSGIV